jgi:ABC-type phosphate/phosphonate transport system substrate-binding protein
MYNANPTVKLAWQRLFNRIFGELGLDFVVIDHSFPEPLSTLWSRQDLGCTFMCGWPFARSNGRVQALASPVPLPTVYGNQSRYRSEFLVRASSEWTSLEETFASRFGWMVEDSQSGFNAPRYVLAGYANQLGRPLFSDVAGPLGNPAQSLAALRNQIVDVIALDSFYLDLLRHHQPGALDQLTTIALTPWTPMPLLVAAQAIPASIIESLASKLCGLDSDPNYQSLLQDVMLKGFVEPDVASFQCLEQMAQASCRLDYAAIR